MQDSLGLTLVTLVTAATEHHTSSHKGCKESGQLSGQLDVWQPLMTFVPIRHHFHKIKCKQKSQNPPKTCLNQIVSISFDKNYHLNVIDFSSSLKSKKDFTKACFTTNKYLCQIFPNSAQEMKWLGKTFYIDQFPRYI